MPAGFPSEGPLLLLGKQQFFCLRFRMSAMKREQEPAT